MNQATNRQRRLVVFFFVLLVHGVLIENLWTKGQRLHFFTGDGPPALSVFFLPSDAPSSRIGSQWQIQITPAPKNRILDELSLPGLAPLNVPEDATASVPNVDWQHELELVAQNNLASSEKEQSYRDLSNSMSASQLQWLKQHHMEPGSAGITWKKPRVEITKDGLPIVHISDRCVLVPIFLLPMVFCAVGGHIEPNGDLFKHMHEPAP